jgi:HTH-type transcriptional regulator/antitoxin HigA
MHHAYAHAHAASVLMRELETGSLSAGDQSAVTEFLGALLPFIENYKKKHLAVPAATPEAMFRFLIEQHDLSQYDLAKEVGGQPVVSDIVRGKRKLTRDHIEKLGRRFHLSPSVFYPAP